MLLLVASCHRNQDKLRSLVGHWAREETLPRETWNFLEKSNKMLGEGEKQYSSLHDALQPEISSGGMLFFCFELQSKPTEAWVNSKET